mmetsp:Transcript_23874/g.49611  ORF Transcript_23874/g.49611 Transcript_23874/m.49611 type:complete len:93 (+) Transcript_23874:1-279(+)
MLEFLVKAGYDLFQYGTFRGPTTTLPKDFPSSIKVADAAARAKLATAQAQYISRRWVPRHSKRTNPSQRNLWYIHHSQTSQQKPILWNWTML